jgi:multidrug resistance efflux pump
MAYSRASANAAIRGAQSAAIRKQIAQQQAEIASATANAAQARVELVEARANLQDLTVTAPFTGTVLTRTARAALEQARETRRLDGDRYIVGVSFSARIFACMQRAASS